MKSCPCHSGKSYTECCKPFHEGRVPETALQLMRSRYSAYTLGLTQYIVETTHPKNPQYQGNLTEWKDHIAQFSNHTDFIDLQILDYDEGSVTFTAHLKQNGRDSSFTEKSIFEKINDRWYYLRGIFICTERASKFGFSAVPKPRG